ncbi:MAG: hypothetical protein AMJ53_16195 [Gammaproteobacteria bacterium SG8_11]|nr:MAG: hypothetical protein AMJ53_16195 [Gammaproteobacteria bacterium SG8_11]
MTNMLAKRPNHHVAWLWALTGLFCLRVIAQPLALIVESPWLPRFNEWHSEVMPYGVLLAFQLAIITTLVVVNVSHVRGSVVRKRRFGHLLTVIGAVYALGMIARLLLGMTLADPSHWFANKISPWFHLVLAAYLLTLARFHLSVSQGGDQ